MRSREIDEAIGNFCRNLRELRKRLEMSEEEMAKRIGISAGNLQKIEQGTVPPRVTAKTLFLIQTRFGISPSSLFSPIDWEEFDHK